MIRRPPRSTLFPYTTALPIFGPGGDLASVSHRRDEERLAHVVRRRVREPERLCAPGRIGGDERARGVDRKSTRLNSSHANISYAVFCLKKKKTHNTAHIM